MGLAGDKKIVVFHILDILTKAIEIELAETASLAIQKTAESVIDKMY